MLNFSHRGHQLKWCNTFYSVSSETNTFKMSAVAESELFNFVLTCYLHVSDCQPNEYFHGTCVVLNMAHTSLGYPGSVRWQHFKPLNSAWETNALHL